MKLVHSDLDGPTPYIQWNRASLFSQGIAHFGTDAINVLIETEVAPTQLAIEHLPISPDSNDADQNR